MTLGSDSLQMKQSLMGYYDALGLSQYVDGEDDSNIVFERICEKVSRKGEFDA